MDKILFINACIRPESRTLELARYLLTFLPGQVEEVNLEQEKIAPLNAESLCRRQNLLASECFDDPMLRYGRQFKEADVIVIAAPFYDYSFPSALKVYLEAIANVGLTFYYDEKDQPQTLCREKNSTMYPPRGRNLSLTLGSTMLEPCLTAFITFTRENASTRIGWT